VNSTKRIAKSPCLAPNAAEYKSPNRRAWHRELNQANRQIAVPGTERADQNRTPHQKSGAVIVGES
jgi:hypothetical protein